MLLDGFEKGYREFVVLRDPIGDHRAEHLVDRDAVRDLNFYFVRRTLSDFQIDFGVDGSGIFAKTQKLRQRTSQAQRLRGAVVLGFSPPGKGEDFIAAAVRDPFAFGGGFGFFGKKTAREAYVYALSRNLHG